MKKKKNPSPLQKRFLNQLLGSWPAIKGSMALVYKPCIRPNCKACASGKKHPNYLLAYTENGKRRCLYVPKGMVAGMEQALKNGRRIEKLLYEMGPALLREYRAENPSQTGPAVAARRSESKKKPPKS